MGLIIKISWRNIMRHKGKSLIIGAILFLGALIMTIGNGVISGMDRGMRKNLVEGFTGDVVIVSDKQESDNVFLPMMGKAIEPINNYRDIKAFVAKLPYVNRFMPAGKNAVMWLSNEASNPGFSYVLGVDFGQYLKVFPDCIRPIEGRLLNPGEEGVLITTGARKQFYEFSNLWCVPESGKVVVKNLEKDMLPDSASIQVTDNMVFMGMNEDNSTADIKVRVKGVAKYRALDMILGHFVITDIESYRRAMGYIAASDKAPELTAEQQTVFNAADADLDAMFGQSIMIVSDVKNAAPVASAKNAAAATAGEPRTVDVDDGTYNMVMVFLKDGTSLEQGAKQLDADLKAAKLNARAVTWKKAFGVIGSMAALIKGSLFVFVMFLFFVAIIIIVNTLSMAALERTSEIGMMRAIGARKGFIGVMFFWETAMLSIFFGGIGIFTGIIAVNIITACHITSQNDIVQLLYGGDTFAPLLTVPDIGMAIVQLALVTLIAMIYPTRVAQSITPLDAVVRE